MNPLSNINFDKIELREHPPFFSYLHITPDRHKQSQGVVIISHGSGGMSDVDLKFANIACSNNYDVLLIDHFTKRGIKSLTWHTFEEACTFQDMANDIVESIEKEKYKKVLLHGISAGGTAVIIASKHATKTFAICPALSFPISSPSSIHSHWPYPYTEPKNLTIVAGERDEWCPMDQARKYQHRTKCKLIVLPSHHGFYNPRNDEYLEDAISLRDGFPKGVTVKYDKRSTDLTYEAFKEWLL